MSSNNNNKDKKNKSLSASSLCKTASKYATRAQTADKAATSRQTRNPDTNTLSDQNMMNKINSVLSEDYKLTVSQNLLNILYSTKSNLQFILKTSILKQKF